MAHLIGPYSYKWWLLSSYLLCFGPLPWFASFGWLFRVVLLLWLTICLVTIVRATSHSFDKFIRVVFLCIWFAFQSISSLIESYLSRSIASSILLDECSSIIPGQRRSAKGPRGHKCYASRTGRLIIRIMHQFDEVRWRLTSMDGSTQ
jgi:hypothetical protein